MARTAAKKQWAEIRTKVRERDENKCVICGKTEHLDCHHLIPREITQYCFEPNNIILLCKSHHKFSRFLSAHGSSIAFSLWLEKNRTWQFLWLKEKIEILLK